MAESRLASVSEFDSYPSDLDNLERLMELFDVIVVDLDSDSNAALSLVERTSAGDAAIVMVYSEQTDQKLAVKCMRAGAREFLTLPIEQHSVTEALERTGSLLQQKTAREPQVSNTPASEVRAARPRLELASSNVAGAPSQDRKKAFDLRGYGRSFEEVLTPHAGPIVKWPTPESITYRDKLSQIQLNATATSPGNFIYTPGAGYMLPAGTHTLWVTFTPTNPQELPFQTSVSIVVNKATPVLTWQAPDEITNGAALDQNQLNATAPIPGTFDYSPSLGTVLPPGNHKLSVTFTPADIANFIPTQASILISIAKEKPAIEWQRPEPVVYGTLVSELQLNAKAFIPGSFEYTPALGSLLAAGEHMLSAVFTPEDASNYSSSRSSVSLTVAKATPFISWPTPEPISLGGALGATQFNAKATVPGSLGYTPDEGEILPPGVHRLSVTLTPTDTLNYTVAHAVVSLTVTEKQTPGLNWAAQTGIPYGTPLSETQLNATAAVPGTFSYTPAIGHVLAPGKYTLSVVFTPSDTERYATAKATSVIEVAEMPDNPLIPVAPQSQTTRSFTSFPSATASSEKPEVATEKPTRETRTYKGAVYEKGDDGKWHLQQN
jgi:FixJ family two-component response regulator